MPLANCEYGLLSLFFHALGDFVKKVERFKKHCLKEKLMPNNNDNLSLKSIITHQFNH
jgi:hypothetical protein